MRGAAGDQGDSRGRRSAAVGVGPGAPGRPGVAGVGSAGAQDGQQDQGKRRGAKGGAPAEAATGGEARADRRRKEVGVHPVGDYSGSRREQMQAAAPGLSVAVRGAAATSRVPQARSRAFKAPQPGQPAESPSSSAMRGAHPVVLGHPVGAARGACLDLPCARGHRQVGDGRVLRLAGAMADKRPPSNPRLGPAAPRRGSPSGCRSG